MTRTVLLFDIDGTLVATGGAGRRAMVGAFAKLHGRHDVFDGLNFAGMTDRAIVRYGLRTVHDTAATLEAEIDRVLDAYLALLEDDLIRSEGYRVLPGVVALLELLRDVPDVAIGLGTGNVRRGAHAKLARGSIHEAFTFGGFGCDAEDRVELLRAGARRGASMLGGHLEECRVVVIGDTPKDIAAARGIGAPCIAVGTGSYGPDELRRSGAHHAFATLADEGVKEAILSASVDGQE